MTHYNNELGCTPRNLSLWSPASYMLSILCIDTSLISLYCAVFYTCKDMSDIVYINRSIVQCM